jgi:hypothetical protein
MPDFRDRIKDFCVGDDFDLRCRVSKIPAGQTVTKAWLTIKIDENDLDAAAVIQKEITTANVAGVGQIEDAGATGTAVLRFDLTRTDTLLLTPDSPYFHDVQIKSGNKISTPFKGMTIAKQQITRDET